MNNAIICNTNTGIDISSSRTLISKNTILQNLNGIIINSGASYNILNENVIAENLGTGIDLRAYARYNTISDNQALKNNLGINISGESNSIYHNMILNSSLGINISGRSNSIHHNMILNNSLGLYIWSCSGNTICCNNFLTNQKNAGFKVYFRERYNKWNNNYWDQPRILPQLIVGKIWLRYQIAISWLNVDWHPAQEPYNI